MTLACPHAHVCVKVYLALVAVGAAREVVVSALRANPVAWLQVAVTRARVPTASAWCSSIRVSRFKYESKPQVVSQHRCPKRHTCT